jgi:hypothetical protein
MNITLEKRATGADRARKRILVPGEALTPTFTDDGMVQVTTKRPASLAPLQRKGFRRVAAKAPPRAKAKAKAPPPPPPPPEPDPEPDPEPEIKPERQVELEAMSMRLLRVLAKELDISGRSSMDHPALVAAILDAEA